MNDLPHLINPFVQAGLRPFETRLAQVNGVRQHRATCMDSFAVTPFLQLDALALQEMRQLLVKLFFSNRFHIWFR